jgi:DNA-directed RNA polymerase specialized sigma24 family protein
MTTSEAKSGDPHSLSSGNFAPTRWTQVLRARGETVEAQAALEELCKAYWQPVFEFIRHTGRVDDASRDLTQEFFARLLARRGLESADPSRGRFRSFLLAGVKNFLADQHDYASAAKRGGGRLPIAIEASLSQDTTAQLQIPDPSGLVPDMVFDRQWGLTLVERVVTRLAADLTAEGKRAQFDTLKQWLLGEVATLSQFDAAGRLGMTEGAVKVAIHRLRKRFRALVTAEIAQTIDDPSQVQDELRYLLDVLSQA